MCCNHKFFLYDNKYNCVLCNKCLLKNECVYCKSHQNYVKSVHKDIKNSLTPVDERFFDILI